MTVGESGAMEGTLREVTKESALNTDAPQIDFKESQGLIHSDLTIGADITVAKALEANEGISSPGVKLHGAGFILTPQEAEHLGLGKRVGLEKYIRNYRNGRDLTSRPRGIMVIDLDGLEIDEVRQKYPEIYQHVLVRVKPERDGNNEEYRFSLP
jgi:hypothetical protein